MRIGIDAHHVNGKPQGSRTYLIELIRALALISADEIFVYSFRPQETARILGDSRLAHRRVFPDSARLRLPLVVPALELRDRLDLLHSQYIAPPLSFAPQVVTIHDILFETDPHWFEGAFSTRSVRLIRRSARRARIVLTVSEFSRRALLERYGLPEEKVLVTPNAVDHETFRPMDTDLEPLRRRYGLDLPFVLSVGRIEPRKNLARLIRAFARARAKLGRDLTLVHAGARDFRAKDVFEQAEKLPSGRVKFLGVVPDEDLPGLYNLAEALAYPSLAEGFGMPLLEAMACGTPVLSSTRGALGEIAGDAALWADPENEDEIASGIEKIVSDVALRRNLRAAGRERAGHFDWRETARRTLAAYRKAARAEL
ncbi:MAG: glycosyltransferase family 4 protein [Vicinamibacteria bacterium]